MDKFLFYLLILLINFQYTTCVITNPTPLDFVKTSCKTTRHPALCVNSLSNYAGSIQGNDQQLAKSAIVVSLNNAKSAAAYVSKLAGTTSNIKPRESQALKDCVNSMTMCVASLTQSIQELGKMAQFKGQNFVWHMNNVQTWVSSALTNQNTCIGGFSDSSMNGQLKDAVNKKMSYVSQVTSNALALVNRFSVKHNDVTHKPYVLQ